MALSKIIAEGVDLTDTFAFTGTVTGAGEITASTTAPSEGGAVTINVVQGLAKAWASIDGSGPTVFRDSFGCASLSDNGGGDTTITLTNAMSNTTYASIGNCDTNNAYSVQFVSMFNNPTGNTDAAPTTTSFRLGTRESAGTGRDADYVLVATHGDLA